MSSEAELQNALAFDMRLAEPRDFQVCLSFDCTDPTNSRSDHEKAALIKAKIETQEIYLAVTPEGNPIGYLSFSRLWPMMLPLISWIYVAPAWRDRGIAHKLVDFCFADLKQRSYDRVMISTQSDRLQMLEKIRGMNITEIGTLLANPYGIGEIFFMKEL